MSYREFTVEECQSIQSLHFFDMIFGIISNQEPSFQITTHLYCESFSKTVNQPWTWLVDNLPIIKHRLEFCKKGVQFANVIKPVIIVGIVLQQELLMHFLTQKYLIFQHDETSALIYNQGFPNFINKVPLSRVIIPKRDWNYTYNDSRL